jgi:hypothetical protein
MGAAAVAGFVAAAAAIPSREQAALKRLAEIEKALMPKYRDPIAEANGDSADMRKPPKSAGSSFLAGLAGQVLHAIQPVLMSAVTAGVTAKAAQPEPPTGGGPDPASAVAGEPTAPESQPAGSDPSI